MQLRRSERWLQLGNRHHSIRICKTGLTKAARAASDAKMSAITLILLI